LNIRFSCVLVLPFLFLAWRHLRGDAQPNMLMGFVYCLCVGAVCLIGAKHGAGPTHLIPFLPAFLFLLVQAAWGEGVKAGGLAVYFLAAMVAYVPSYASNLVRLAAWSRDADDPAFKQEAEQLYAAYPAAAMGATDGAAAGLTGYKMVGVFAGGPLVFDTSTWMDLHGAGVSDEVTEGLLVDCRTPFWILPNAGIPFSQIAAYDPRPMFSDRFRTLFAAGYVVVRKGAFYSVWGCRDAKPGR
jgi:hypothetical protein